MKYIVIRTTTYTTNAVIPSVEVAGQSNDRSEAMRILTDLEKIWFKELIVDRPVQVTFSLYEQV